MQTMKLLLWIMIWQVPMFMGSQIVRSNMDWYHGLNQPFFSPPDWIFGMVWVVLYLLLAVAGFYITRKGLDDTNRKATWLMLIQLVLNSMWTPLFFGMHHLMGSMVLVLLMIGMTLWLMRAAKFLASLKSFKPNYLLSRVVEEFQKEGFEFVSSALFLERFMPPKGTLTKRDPTPEEEKSIAFGYKTAKAIAGLDIGLTCVVSQDAVIAVEGMEGTDACILRAGELYRKSAEKKSAVAVVKVARPNQDDRFDLPVIGKGTMQALKDSGLKLLAFEAEKTLVLDLEEVIKLADENGICLTAI